MVYETADRAEKRTVRSHLPTTQSPAVTTPAPPVADIAPVLNDSAAPTFSDDQKQRITNMADKTGMPTDTEAAQMKIIQAALSPDELAALGLNFDNVISSREGMQDAGQNLEDTGAPTTTGIGVLQSALTAKTDEFNREASMPDAMAAAGITGYGALQSTMAAKQKEIDTRISGLKDRLMEQGNKEADVYNAALNKYEILKGEYDIEADRMNKVVQNIMDHDQSMEYLNKQNALSKDLAEFKAGLSSSGDGTYGDGYGGSYGGGNWDVPEVEALSNIFIPGDASSYRAAGEWECGEGFNDLTDGTKVGDSWKSKLDATTKKNNPKAGNGLATPWGGTNNGHMATVLDFDEDTGTVYTVEFNHNADGKQTFEQYTIKGLNEAYGDAWGFTDSTLKPQYQAAFDSEYSGTDPEWFTTYLNEYAEGTYTEKEIKTKIGQQPNLSTSEKNYYKTRFDTRKGVGKKSNIAKTVEGATGEAVEDLPFPLDIILGGMAKEESPQEKRERKETEKLITNPDNLDEFLKVIDVDMMSDEKSSILSKIKAEFDGTDYQAKLIYAALMVKYDDTDTLEKATSIFK